MCSAVKFSIFPLPPIRYPVKLVVLLCDDHDKAKRPHVDKRFIGCSVSVVWFINEVTRPLREELACVHSYCRASSIQVKVSNKGQLPLCNLCRGNHGGHILHAHYNFDILHTIKIP